MLNQLSSFRILWIQVLFDLPVTSDEQRKSASKFRNSLLDLGFEMAQFSVYQRFCNGTEIAEKYIKKIEKIIPNDGKVHILKFTDKQYENIITFNGRAEKKSPKNPDQYELF
jgi:CRISPR-associated protein Cas2